MEQETTNRVLKLRLDNEQFWKSKKERSDLWISLRRLSYQCSAFGNQLLNESYAKAKGFSASGTYTDFSDKLSAAVRDAISRECVGIWRRLGKVILRGEQTLARFSASRAIVVRDRGIKLENDAVILRLYPAEQGEATRLRVRIADDWTHDLYAKLLGCEYETTKATVRFRGYKADIILHYQKAGTKLNDEPRIAVVHINDKQQTVIAPGATFNLAHFVYNLARMKEQFAGIHARLGHTWNRRGSKAKWHFRKALVKAGNYDQWCEIKLHQMSRAIVNWCTEQKIGTLTWNVEHGGDLPLDRLRLLLKYKCEDAGVAFSQTHGAQTQKAGFRQKQHKAKGKKLDSSIFEKPLQ